MAILQQGNRLGVCVHHSVYKPANNLAELKVQAKLFNDWHKSKSWAEDTKTEGDYPYISYHYLMATNGDMLKVTKEKYVKYHAGDNFRKDLSFNLHGIAVCLTGNYENDKPTDAQMKALVLFIRDVEKRYDINARVRGHKETSASATACPGKNIGTSSSGWLKQVIANVNDKNYPPIPPPPPPQTPPSECEKEKARIIELEKGIKTLEEKNRSLETKLELCSSEKVDIQAQLKQEKDKLKVSNERIEHLEGVMKENEEEWKETIKKYEGLEEEIKRVEKEKVEWQEKYENLKKEYEETQVSLIKRIVEFLAKVFKKDK